MAWLLAGVLLLWGLAWAVLPGVVKSQLEHIASERLGRTVHVGSVRVHPWSLELTLTDLSVAGPGGQGRQLKIGRVYLNAELQSLLKLAPVVDALVVEEVSATLTHHGDGRYDIDDILARLANAAKPEEAPRPLPRFALYNLRLDNLSLDFVDQPAGKTHTVRALTFSLPFLSNLDSLREVSTEPRLAFELNGAHFDSAAQSTPFAVSHKTQAQFHLTGLDARSLLPYLPKNLPLRLQSGLLDVDMRVAFEQTDKPQVKISGAVQAKGVRLADAQAHEVLAFDALRVEIAELRPLDQVLALAAVELNGPVLDLRRDKSGAITLLTRKDPMPESRSAQSPPASAHPWQIDVARMALRSGQVRWMDQAMAPTVALEARDVTFDAAGFAWPKAPPMQASGAFTLRPQPGTARDDAAGQMGFTGVVAPQPLSVQGKLQATRLPLQVLAPYLAQVLRVDLLRAQAGFSGDLSYTASDQGPVVQLRGDVALDGVQANSVAAAGASAAELPLGQELLSWKSLSVRGLALAMSPGQSTSVDVGQTAVTDFYARIIVNENGRINLQDLVKSSNPAAAASRPAAAPVAKPPLIRIGQTSLINGRVLFSDRFIQPNYTARLTELTGRLGAFSSAPASGAAPQMAELELRGRAEGSASLEILGKLNPLVQPLALDIQGRMRNLELTPLSPYSVRYAGHGIERGQLSMDVAYRVEPDGQLTASNKLVLNQLSFGDPVEGAPNSLPVRLAVALLADRNGVIDVDLPISGSLNDPEFSLGSVILKVIVNLVTKAVTAPFSLLSSLFSGGDEHSVVSFAPGSAMLDAQARGKLDQVAQTLKERPALRMTVTGFADLDAERQAYRQERLRALLQAEKQRAAVVAGKSAEVGPLNAAETPALLREVYRRAAIPKPRNLIGMTKNITPAEMEALLLANIAVNETAMRELAAARGAAVKDYLGARELPAAQLFLGNPKLLTADAKGGARAELELAVK